MWAGIRRDDSALQRHLREFSEGGLEGITLYSILEFIDSMRRRDTLRRFATPQFIDKALKLTKRSRAGNLFRCTIAMFLFHKMWAGIRHDDSALQRRLRACSEDGLEGITLYGILEFIDSMRRHDTLRRFATPFHLAYARRSYVTCTNLLVAVGAHSRASQLYPVTLLYLTVLLNLVFQHAAVVDYRFC